MHIAVDQEIMFLRVEKPEAILPEVMKGKVRINEARGKADESRQQHHTETESCQETMERTHAQRTCVYARAEDQRIMSLEEGDIQMIDSSLSAYCACSV